MPVLYFFFSFSLDYFLTCQSIYSLDDYQAFIIEVRSHKRRASERERERTIVTLERFSSRLTGKQRGLSIKIDKKNLFRDQWEENYSIQSWIHVDFLVNFPFASIWTNQIGKFFSFSFALRNFTNLSQMICSFVYQFVFVVFLSNCHNWSTHSKLLSLRKISLNTFFSNPFVLTMIRIKANKIIHLTK